MAVRAGNLFALDGLGTSGTGIYDAVCKCIWGQEKVSLAYGKAVGLFFLLNVLSYRADCGLESALIHSACACIGPAASGVVIQCMYNKADKTAHGWEKWFFYGFYPVHLLLLWMIQFAKSIEGTVIIIPGCDECGKKRRRTAPVFFEAGR